MPKTTPDIKSKIGNVSHPFSEKTIDAANKIYGEEHEREIPHPLKQINPDIPKDSAAYNALAEMGMIDKFTKPAHPSVIPGVPNTTSKPVGLPSVNIPSTDFTLGSYANPQSTTSSDDNVNSNTINPYSFMDDDLLTKKMPEHVNKFGFHKRNLPSLDARYKKALNEGKLVKAERIKKKMDNFKANQQARSGRNKDGERTGTGTGFGNFLRKINPKNWL